MIFNMVFLVTQELLCYKIQRKYQETQLHIEHDLG